MRGLHGPVGQRLVGVRFASVYRVQRLLRVLRHPPSRYRLLLEGLPQPVRGVVIDDRLAHRLEQEPLGALRREREERGVDLHNPVARSVDSGVSRARAGQAAPAPAPP